MASAGASDNDSEVGSVRRRGSRKRAGSTTSSIRSGETKLSRRESKQPEKKARPGATLTREEETAVGSVKWEVYKNYLKAMGIVGVTISLIAFFLTSVFYIFTSLWLSAWSEDAADSELRGSTSQRDYRLGVYAAFGVGGTLSTLVAFVSLNLLALQGGEVLHEKMLERILRAPMSFYDTTPMGRILNRFENFPDRYINLI